MTTKQVKSTGNKKPPAAGMGRKLGSVNKTTTAVKEALLMAFDGLGGVPALIEWGRENPTPFYQTWAKLLPQELKAELEVKNVTRTPEEIDARIAFLLDKARARRDSANNDPS